MDKLEVLKKYFGHSSFRVGQGEISDNILSCRDCLEVMPTGAGKSMCFQIPALMMNGVTIVISPLISLMKDQVESLVQSGVPAAYINSSQQIHEYYAVLRQLSTGELKILYVAPERLVTAEFLALCHTLTIPFVAVDEAHCVSQWGQDFRPSYLKIAGFVEALPSRPIIAAFTATATELVKHDILEILKLRSPFATTTGFDRENLYFEVRSGTNSEKDGMLINILRSSGGRSSIVYCSTRKNVEQVCDLLRLNGFSAARYHAGLPDTERKQAQEDFIYDRVNIIVATNAFGMGIDKSDVSLVVHYNMPKDIESYYQEAGRAGRDGSPARCILLYSKSDVRTNNFMIDRSHEESELPPEQAEEMRERDRERLKQMTFYSTTKRCLREFILRYFGEKTGSFCGNCSTCNASFDTVDITIEAQKAISCVFRMSKRGISGSKQLVADILRGTAADSAAKELSTFGIMSDETPQRIIQIVDYLIAEGYIEESGSNCQLTTLADEFIRNRRTLLMKQPKRSAQPDEPVHKQKASDDCNPELFELLKALRKKIASTLGVPAYVVFTDASLREISVKQPLTTQEFMNISGVGSIKAERYCKKFSEVIKQYQQSKA